MISGRMHLAMRPLLGAAIFAGVSGPLQATAATNAAPTAITAPSMTDIAGATSPGDRARGVSILDGNGGLVGTIVGASANSVTIRTPHNSIQVPINALHKSANGITLGATAAQIDAAMAVSAALQAKNLPAARPLPAMARPAVAQMSQQPAHLQQPSMQMHPVLPTPPAASSAQATSP